MSTPTETRMPPIGADVHLEAYCCGCGRQLGRWRFEWDGQPRTFSSHICGGDAQNVAYRMEWLEVGEPLDDSDEGPTVSGPR